MEKAKRVQFSTIKTNVDSLMDILFGAGVASHHTIIEQLNYLLFLRALTKRDDDAIVLGNKEKQIFKDALAKYRWDNLLMLNAEVLFTTLEEIYRKLPDLIDDRTINLLYRDAHVKIYDKPTLRRFLHEIEKMMSDLEKEYQVGHNDIFGDMYEYLLSKLSQAGTMGQFRTPRHIIDFIVDVVDPKKGETILDPACGTAGFLVSALEHLKHTYTSEEFKKEGKYPMDLLSHDERNFIYSHTFTGFDSDSDMIKFGLMNLYLHQLDHPHIVRQNTLMDTAGDRTKWDVILANPPFAGAIDRDSISEDLRMGTRATEILFLKYMIDHLSDKGRAGIIVPEGVIFSNSNAHKKIRQMLIEEAGLWCVVSLPSGVFNPYAGVKTSIIFFDKNLVSKNNEILFVKIENDGYSLGAQRNPIDKNDLPKSLETISHYNDFMQTGDTYNDAFLERIKESKKIGETIQITHDRYKLVSKSLIEKNEDYNLSSDRYKIEDIFSNQKWPMVNIEDLCSFEYGKSLPAKDRIFGLYPVMGSNGRSGFHNNFLVKGPVIIVGRKGSAGEVVWENQSCYPIDTTYYIKLIDDKKVLLKFLYFMLISLELTKLKGGAGIPGLNRNDVYKHKIPLPPLEIQIKIVEQIEEEQKLIDSNKKLIKIYEQKIKDKIAEVWSEE
ncbi:MAG: N-6 DNA methylase [Candidatus Levyibacteriota bacterium]